MESFKPLVSIIIPVYNGSNFMKEAIDSAISQTYKNIEIIVVNDGSTDETDDIALSYGEKIRYFKKENGGVSSALNLGIEKMKGEYFSWLSHDDVYTPDKIEKSIVALELCEDKNTLIYCASKKIDKNSMPLTNGPAKPVQKFVSWQQAIFEMFKKGTYGGCAFLIPKKAFDICDGFSEEYRFIQDKTLWFKFFFNKFSILKIPDVCVMSRIHGGQLTQTGQTLFRKESCQVSDYMISELLKISSKENNFIKAYILYNAKYNVSEVVQKAVREAKKAKLLSAMDVLQIFVECCYGKVRPFIRKVYYRVFRKIKTS